MFANSAGLVFGLALSVAGTVVVIRALGHLRKYGADAAIVGERELAHAMLALASGELPSEPIVASGETRSKDGELGAADVPGSSYRI